MSAFPRWINILAWSLCKTKACPHTFWLLPISIFGSFTVTRFITDSHTFTLPLSLASYRVMLAELVHPRGFNFP